MTGMQSPAIAAEPTVNPPSCLEGHDEIARSGELNVIANVNYELRRYG